MNLAGPEGFSFRMLERASLHVGQLGENPETLRVTNYKEIMYG